eukprot:96938-Amphidinium_carterae.1
MKGYSLKRIYFVVKSFFQFPLLPCSACEQFVPTTNCSLISTTVKNTLRARSLFARIKISACQQLWSDTELVVVSKPESKGSLKSQDRRFRPED